MLPDVTDLANTISLTPAKAIGIPIALVGAVFLAIGAQLQHRGVVTVETLSDTRSSGGLRLGQLLALLRRPSWVFGTLLLGLAVVFQLTSLYFAPIIVVQPLGAIALIITAVVNARVSGVKLTRRAIRSLAFCIVGVGLFVTIATITGQSKEISQTELVIVLVLLVVITVAFAIVFALLRKRFEAIIYIVGAGVLYGFVATLAKVVIDRIHTLFIGASDTHGFEWLTLTCVIALIAAAAMGGYFVQSAYSSGPPDLVIAGLTVIDPLVAVSIGIVVLQEASGAPWYAIVAFIVAGILAVYGVFQLSKHHPQTQH
ncbi:DMT family transporter [Lacisediminihabitans sp.]|uniref:DMT family transporter n=1 Tax=Lacisediminihabitans sp. TaxID=2787631 RepID=UPI002F9583CB